MKVGEGTTQRKQKLEQHEWNLACSSLLLTSWKKLERRVNEKVENVL